MKKNILLSLAGLSPQVITQTLYGIIEQKLSWPDKIYVLTTLKGKEQIRLSLIHANEQQLSWLERLCLDYNKPLPDFTVDDIFIICNQQGKELKDVTNKADQQALTQFIADKVKTLCGDRNTRLHASIAGGRKNMISGLVYAMNLYAREHDRLTHTAVDKAFEGNQDFYYPTPYTHVITAPNNRKLDTSLAHVYLFDTIFMKRKSQVDEGGTQLVSKLCGTPFPDVFDELHLVFDISSLTLQIAKAHNTLATIHFSKAKLEFAFYLFAIRLKQNGHVMKRPFDSEYDKYYANLYLQELERINGILPLSGHYDQLLIQRLDLLKNHSRTVESLKFGISNTFLDQRKHTLKKILRRELIPELADSITAVVNYRSSRLNLRTDTRLEYTIIEGKYTSPFYRV